MIKDLTNYVNETIAEMGVVLAMKKVMKKCNTEVKVQSSQEIDNVLKNFSGIVVANHPAESDILAILSTIKNRKDVFLIINSNFKEMIPELDKYLIPVYINNKIFKSFEGRLKMKILGRLTKIKNYPVEEERQKNRESIKLAIEKINQGGLVIIFPSGGNEKVDWFSGVGHLIHGIKNTKKSFVVRAYIEGTSNWDYLRLLPFVGKLLPKLKVNFAKPLVVEKIKKEDPKITTKYLEEKYQSWVTSFDLWRRVSKNYLWLRTLFLFLITKYY